MNREKSPKHYYQFDSFRVDVTERQLWQGEEPVLLTPKVFDVLLVLLERKGQTVEKEELIQRVWADTYVEEGSLSRSISTLRKTLGDGSNEQKYIKTLPKIGYRFTGNVKEFIEEIEIDETILQSKEKALLPTKPQFQKNGAKTILVALAIIIIAAIIIWLINRPPEIEVELNGLTENERQLLAKFGSKNKEAIENYVKGRTLWHNRSAEGLYQSIIHLERAVKFDQNFAIARAALADAYAFDSQKWEMAKAEAEEAIRLNPSLGEPFAAIGFVQMFWEWDIYKARESLKKATELSPNYSTAHQWYALNLVFDGQGAGALVEMKRALESEPNSIAINADLCQMFYFLQKYDDALAQCQKTLAMDENFLNAHTYLYDIYTAKEMYDEAVAEFFKIEQLKNNFSIPSNQMEIFRKSYENGGIQAFWKAQIEYEEKKRGKYALPQYYLRLGDKEKAMVALQKLYEQRDFNLIYFLGDPVFQDLAKEPKFLELVSKFNK